MPYLILWCEYSVNGDSAIVLIVQIVNIVFGMIICCIIIFHVSHLIWWRINSVSVNGDGVMGCMVVFYQCRVNGDNVYVLYGGFLQCQC